MFDRVFRQATIVDGLRTAPFVADVGIRGDRIVAVGQLGDPATGETIDARGLTVAPGFIDVHNHSDGWLLRGPHMSAKTLQGFTTEVLAADGIGYAPLSEETVHEWIFYLHALDALRLEDYEGWKTLGEYGERIGGRNVQNVLVHIPYANVRSLACGFGRAPPDDYQRRVILAEIERGLADGAVGLSTGLDYIAECHATTEELVEACRPVAAAGGVYATHIRYKRGILPALEEAVNIGRRSRVAVHVSHLKGTSPEQVEQILEFVDRVARNDVDFSFDVYPYQSGSTMLSYLLPYEVWDEGPLAATRRLSEPALRARFGRALAAWGIRLDALRIAWLPSHNNRRHVGRLLSDFVAESRARSPEDALADLLVEEQMAVLLVLEDRRDELVRPLLAHDRCMAATDGIYWADGHVHPRFYGTTGRVLGPCVRQWHWFDLATAVYKLSGYPAQRFGVMQRGAVREGYFADLVVFDADSIQDMATYDQPHAFTRGVRHLLVNGVPIVRDGQPVPDLPAPLPGRFLRRARL